MEEKLPSCFDVVVVGTGVTECVVSAAAARNGHSVLHMDPRDYYGSSNATLNLDAWTGEEFANTPPTIPPHPHHSLLTWRNPCRGLQQVWYAEGEGALKEELLKNKRRFNIDVSPQVILAREEMIELLIKSDVSRYLEFLRVGKLFTNLPPPNEDVVCSIPLSRADIFTSKSVGLAEKRGLVKFIEAVMKKDQENPEATENVGQDPSDDANKEPETFQTFGEIATACKLSEKVKHLIKNAVETVEDGFISGEGDDSFNSQFVPRCRKYLTSIGRFGNQTPYLWPLYGIGEICQAFCRLSAVYGSIFILKRYISSMEILKSGEEGIKFTSESDEFTAKHLVIGPELTFNDSSTMSADSSARKVVGRGVIVTRGSNLKVEADPTSKGDGICFYRIGNMQVVELSHTSQAVPKNYRLLQITFPFTNEALSKEETPRNLIESRLQPFVNFDVVNNTKLETEINDAEPGTSESIPSKPQAVYASYFWLDFFEEIPSVNNVHSCSVNSTELSRHISKAEEIFTSMFPGEEFLPKPPDAEQDHDEEESDMAAETVQSEESPTVESTSNITSE